MVWRERYIGFLYSKLKDRIWDIEIIAYVALIHELKGKHTYTRFWAF